MRKDPGNRAMLLDKRVVERNIKKGLVTREEYDKSVSSLPDVADGAELIKARLGDPEAEESDADAG